jgi:hypothetical protein
MSERDAIVAWDSLSINKGREVTVTFDNTADAFAFFNELKDRSTGDHLPASVAGECAGCEGFPSIENNPCAVCGQAHRATHAGEVERLREALRRIASSKTELSDKSDYARGWNDARFTMGQIARLTRPALPHEGMTSL